MPLIQRKGAQSSQGFGEFAAASGVNPNAYIENLFSTYLYTGNSQQQIIGNGVALSSNNSAWSTSSLTYSGINYGSCVNSDSSGNYYVGGYYGTTGFIANQGDNTISFFDISLPSQGVVPSQNGSFTIGVAPGSIAVYGTTGFVSNVNDATRAHRPPKNIAMPLIMKGDAFVRITNFFMITQL